MSMQSLIAASQSMSRMQTVQSAKTQMQSTANILRIESKQDGGNEKKLAAADALEKKSADLTGDLMGEINDVNKTLKPDEEVKTEDKKEEKGDVKEKSADTVTLSDTAREHGLSSPKVYPVTGEAVTYDAVGSMKASTFARNTPSLDAAV